MMSFSTSFEKLRKHNQNNNNNNNNRIEGLPILFYPSPDRIMMERLRPDDDAAIFFYTGQENVPDGVIHA